MWTAVTLWVVTFAGIAIYALVASRHVASGSPIGLWVLGMPALYFGVVLFLCAVYFSVAWFWRARRPREVRIAWRGTLRLLWREYRTLAGAAPRMMFYGWLVRDPAPTRGDTPVLLLHGVLCNAGVWMRMSRFLTRRGITGRLQPLVWTSARVDRNIRRPACGEGRRDARGDRCAFGDGRCAQHGRARRARLHAEIRRRQGRARDDDRRTPPRKRSCLATLRHVARANASGESMACGAQPRADRSVAAVRLAMVVARLDGRTADVVGAPRCDGRHA